MIYSCIPQTSRMSVVLNISVCLRCSIDFFAFCSYGVCYLAVVWAFPQYDTTGCDGFFWLNNVGTWKPNVLSSSSGVSSVLTRLAFILLLVILIGTHFQWLCICGILLYLFVPHCSPFFFSVMAITSGARTPSTSGGLHYATFTLDLYHREYKDFLGTDWIDAMPSNDDADMMYYACNGFCLDTALGVRGNCCAHWGGCSGVPRKDDIWYVDMPFIRCEEEYGYA